MNRPWQTLGPGFRVCGDALVSLLHWTLWLFLALLLIAQLYVLTTNEMALPGFLQRRLEERLAVSGLQVRASRTLFDPTGRILLENPGFYLPAFAEPVLSARAVFLRLNPWLLAAGVIEPKEVRILEGAAAVPAMLSASGQPEALVEHLDATIHPEERSILISQFNARIAGITVTAHGRVRIPGLPAAGDGNLSALLSRNFEDFCRKAEALAQQLKTFDQPVLNLKLAPGGADQTEIAVELLARAATLEAPIAARASNLRISTRALFFGESDISSLTFAAERLDLPLATVAYGVKAFASGRLRPGGAFDFEPAEFGITAARVESAGFAARTISAVLRPQALPEITAEIVAQIMGTPLAVEASANWAAKTAAIRFAGEVSRDLIDPISRHADRDLGRFFDFATLTCSEGRLQLDEGWKFARLDARLAGRGVVVRGVLLGDGAATVELAGRRFRAPAIYVSRGKYFARGSFTQDFDTNRFRFLLEGRLLPMDIAPWFRGWWSKFFRQFDFPAVAPGVNVDFQGIWRVPAEIDVFVAADSVEPVIRGAAFDHLRTRLHITFGRFEGLAVEVNRGKETARGTFTHVIDPTRKQWRRLDLNLESTMNVDVARQILGPIGEQVLAPFRSAAPPTVALQGYFEGPASPTGRHHALNVAVRTTGEFHFHGFPLPDAAFKLRIDDEEIAVSDFSARFAGGNVGGEARLWADGGERRLGFDLMIKDASLGKAAAIAEAFFARREGRPPAPAGRFIQERVNVQIDFDASAEGPLNQPYAYQGGGSAVLRGTEIGSIPLLGQLSELLRFTEMHFRDARGNFTIEGPRLVFSEIALRGTNSAVDGRGNYSLERRQLDFKLKVLPFHDSGNLIKSVVGTVLSPLSTVLEVNLTGTPDKPQWAFVIGPTSLLRGLSGAAPPQKPAEKAAPATTESPRTLPSKAPPADPAAASPP